MSSKPRAGFSEGCTEPINEARSTAALASFALVSYHHQFALRGLWPRESLR